MAKNQKCGLSEDAELHGWGGGGVWERRGGAHMAIKGGTCVADMPWGFGQLFPSPRGVLQTLVF